MKFLILTYLSLHLIVPLSLAQRSGTGGGGRTLPSDPIGHERVENELHDVRFQLYTILKSNCFNQKLANSEPCKYVDDHVTPESN